MKIFIIFLIFFNGFLLYSEETLSPFGINHTIDEKFHSLTQNNKYREKYKRTMDLAVEAGIKWWRAQNAFRWYNIQPDSLTKWNFETEDSLVKWVNEKGLYLLPEIGFTADSARHDKTDGLSPEKSRQYPPDPSHWDDYKKYIDTLVKRYKKDIKYWQFSNEPDGGGHTGFLGTPVQYIEMFESTRVTLKAADPTAKILGFDMCSPKTDFKWEYFDTNSNSINDSTFGYKSWENAISSLIDSIGLDNIDVISQHFYLGTESFKIQIDKLKQKVGENKPIWITESGFMNSSPFKAERGKVDKCVPTGYVEYNCDSGYAFWDTVLVKWASSEPCSTMIDTFLKIGDTVVLYKRSNYGKDTIVFHGGNLIYKDTDTALAIGDSLTIFDYWVEETKHHNRYKQDTSYMKLLDMLNNTSLENIKIFFFCADNNINKHYYPPQIRFGSQNGIPTGYYRQRKHNFWSIIDTNENPYPSYNTIKNHIKKVDTTF